MAGLAGRSTFLTTHNPYDPDRPVSSDSGVDMKLLAAAAAAATAATAILLAERAAPTARAASLRAEPPAGEPDTAAADPADPNAAPPTGPAESAQPSAPSADQTGPSGEADATGGATGGATGADNDGVHSPAAVAARQALHDALPYAPIGEPLAPQLGGEHAGHLMVNKPLIGFRHLNKADTHALCPEYQCAHSPKGYFMVNPEYKESPCKLHQAKMEAIVHDKYNPETGQVKPAAEFCRELYSVDACLDANGAVTEKEWLAQRQYITGVQCLRQQEQPWDCECTPFGPAELRSDRETFWPIVVHEDGTDVPRPLKMPVDKLTSAMAKYAPEGEETGGATGATGETGGATGETGGATGATGETGGATGATGGEEDVAARNAALTIKSPPVEGRESKR